MSNSKFPIVDDSNRDTQPNNENKILFSLANRSKMMSEERLKHSDKVKSSISSPALYLAIIIASAITAIICFQSPLFIIVGAGALYVCYTRLKVVTTHPVVILGVLTCLGAAGGFATAIWFLAKNLAGGRI
jgi:hypothetical protein